MLKLNPSSAGDPITSHPPNRKHNMSFFSPTPANDHTVYARFDNIGDTISGPITKAPNEIQQNEFGTGKPLFWDDAKTQPRMQMVITVQTEDRDPQDPEDTGLRVLFIKKPSALYNSIANAVVTSGITRDPDAGDKLTITYTGLGEKTNPAYNAPKQFTATFTPAAGFFSGTTASTPAVSTDMPVGMDPKTWAELTPEVRAQLKAVASA